MTIRGWAIAVGMLMSVLLGSCGTVPDAAALLHTNPLYLVV